MNLIDKNMLRLEYCQVLQKIRLNTYSRIYQKA